MSGRLPHPHAGPPHAVQCPGLGTPQRARRALSCHLGLASVSPAHGDRAVGVGPMEIPCRVPPFSPSCWCSVGMGHPEWGYHVPGALWGQGTSRGTALMLQLCFLHAQSREIPEGSFPGGNSGMLLHLSPSLGMFVVSPPRAQPAAGRDAVYPCCQPSESSCQGARPPLPAPKAPAPKGRLPAL